jgi:hypothetical protein
LVDRILIQGSSAAKLPPEVQEARAKVKAEREKRQTKPPPAVVVGQDVVAKAIAALAGRLFRLLPQGKEAGALEVEDEALGEQLKALAALSHGERVG